jgi:hypothetical protein
VVTTEYADFQAPSSRPAHRRQSGTTDHRYDRWLAGLLVVLAVGLAFLGLAERVWIVDHAPINSDQAVVGLMAKGILHGHFVAFFWGQYYAGAEPYLTSALFALFGSSDTTLNLTPVVLAITATCLVYLIGRHYLPRVFAALAALTIWVWPTISVTNSTQEIGYVFACLNFGLLAVLFATRISRRRRGMPANWAMLGLSLGACLWASPECLFFLVPCGWLVAPFIVRTWRSEPKAAASDLAMGTGGAAVGGLPFWWATVTTHFATITHPNRAPYPGTLASRTKTMLTDSVPLVTGLRRPYSGTWFGGTAIAVPALVLILVVVVSAVMWAVMRHRPRLVLPLVAFVIAYLLIYPGLPPTYSWQDGRFIVFLPFLLIVVVMYPPALVRWRRIALALAAVVVLSMACVTVLELPGTYSTFSARQLAHALQVERSSTAALQTGLERYKFSKGYAAYWLAYKLDFESHSALTYTPVPADSMRNRAYLDTVDRAPRPAWIVCQPANTALCSNATNGAAVNPPGLTWASLSSWLGRNHIEYGSATIDGFTVIVPAGRITPAVLQKAGILAS